MTTKTPSEQAVEALEHLARDYEEKANQVRSYIQSIQTGANTVGALPLPANGSNNHVVRPNQYSRMKFGQALIAYLSERGTVPVSRVAQDLFIGGVATLVKQKSAGERIRRVRITIGNNKKRLIHDESSDTVRLVPEKVRRDDAPVAS